MSTAFVLLAGLLPVLLAGPALVLDHGGRWVRAARSAAVAAALLVIVVELLPSATEALGLLALGVAAVGLLLAMAAERWIPRPGSSVGVAMVVLALHQAFDGVQMGALAGPLGLPVVIAIGMHGLPLVAVAGIAAARVLGRGRAALLWSGLVASTAVGMLAGLQVPEAWLAGPGAWLTALIAGALLHMLLHDMLQASRPGGERVADLGGLAVGGVLALALLRVHHGLGPAHEGAAEASGAFLTSLADLSLETAPMLLLGLLLGAWIQAAGPGLPTSWLRGGSRLIMAVRGALVGIPLPVCACGILPVADSLAVRAAAPALVVAFLLATPELGVDSFALSVQFLGWQFALLRLGAALLVAVVAGVVVAMVVRPQGGAPDLPVHRGDVPLLRRWGAAVDGLLLDVGPLIVAGLVVAATVQAFVRADDLVWLATTGLDVPAVSLAAMPSYVCASAVTPLAGVLWAKGLSPGAVLAGLLLGPATNVATVAFLARVYGGRAAAAGIAAVVLTAWACAGIANLTLPATAPVAAAAVEGVGHGPVAWIASAIVAAGITASLIRHGSRPWLAVFGTSAPSGSDRAAPPPRTADCDVGCCVDEGALPLR